MGGSGGAGGFVAADCISEAQCDDGVPCTIDRCLKQKCAHEIQTQDACPAGQYCAPNKGGCVAAPKCMNDTDCTGAFGGDLCFTKVYCGAGTCEFSLLDADSDLHVAPQCGGDDCDDNAFAVFPGAPEICDGVDNDCNDLTDNEDPTDELNKIEHCGTCENNCYNAATNCDVLMVNCQPSADPGKVPGVCSCGGCEVDYYDIDGDGLTCEYFCVKSNGGIEICNDGLDNDCDGKIDAGPGCP